MHGIYEILVLGIVGVIAYRMLFLRRWNQISLVVPFFAALLIAGIVLNVVALRSPRGRRPAARPQSVVTSSVPVTVNVDSSVAGTVRLEETDHGKMLVMPLSQASLADYLGPEGAAALENISSALPEGLKQAYFMVPVPGAVDGAVPGLRALATAISRVTETAARAFPASGGVAAENTNSLQVAESEPDAVVRPDWLTQPGENDIVVKTEFEPSPDLLEADLQKQVTQALLSSAWDEVAPRSAEKLMGQRPFQMTSSAIQSCIQDRFQEEVDLNTGDGTRMFSVSALLQFPEDLKVQAKDHVQQTVQNQRTATVGAAAISFGLVVILAAGLLQLAGSSGRIARYVGVPLIALAMLPGVAISGWLVQRVAANENVDIPSPFALPDTLIDYQPEDDSLAEFESIDTKYLD